MSKNVIIFISLYLIAFGVIVGYNLTHPIVNDGVYEYADYKANIAEGWHYRWNDIANSCLISTWIPALIYKATWFGDAIFRIFPAFFYALMPAFTYLIAKRYLIARYAFISSLVILFSSFMLFFPDIGRVGVALGLFAGLTWALLSRKLWWALTFAVLLVFAHYITCLIAIGMIFVVIATNYIMKRKLLKQYALVFCVLLLLFIGWHFFIAQSSGEYMLYALFRIGELPPHSDYALQGLEGISFFNIESRGIVEQEAFGLTLSGMNIPEKIEWVFNWLVVGIVTYGAYITMRNKEVDLQFKTMLISLYALILITIAVPWLSMYYGAQRVYFTASIVLAVCFVLAIQKVARMKQWLTYTISAVVLIPYALCTSGLIYNIFGLEKTIPIHIMVEG